MPCTISYITTPIVGYCHRCHQRIYQHDQVWVATDDDFLCPYYKARKLVFCSKDCLERTMESVLAQIKRNRTL